MADYYLQSIYWVLSRFVRQLSDELLLNFNEKTPLTSFF
jgi:hypothetical protein